MNETRVLLVEDDVRAAQSLHRVLEGQGFSVTVAHRGDEGFDRARNEEFHVVVTDLRMPGLGGLELVRELHAAKPRLPIVLVTAFGTTETAIEATKYGAFEYLLKPFEIEEFLEVVRRAATNGRAMLESIDVGAETSARQAIIGRSRAMQTVYKEIGRVTGTSATVLIRGETGTGKELVARAIYQHSDRAAKPFIAVNCAAIPETLLESELFGHEKGSFTGADQRRIGRFEQAHGGTLFLDEIGDMSAFTQAKLLRVLQDKTIQRVGGKETIAVDVRLIAATHRRLEELIAEKSFREDLYYRLSAVVIQLPALSERKEDVPELVRYFVGRFAAELKLSTSAVPAAALEWFQQRPWAGNVRELENIVRQAMLAARGFPITRDILERMTEPKRAEVATSLESLIESLLKRAKDGEDIDVHARALEAMEEHLFTQAYSMAGENQALASRWLKVSRQTMREKLQRFGVRESNQAG